MSLSARSLALALLAVAGHAGVALADAPADAPLDFSAELKELSAIAACDGRGFDTAKFDKATVDAHCKALAPILERYKREWLAVATPFFADLVPKDIPKTVVYPFGGADLMTVLAVFPEVHELTTLSLEAGGDPRQFGHLDARRLARSLALHRQFIDKLVTVNHSRTLDLGRLKLDPLPSQVVFGLVGLAIHGDEPVSLKYFRLNEDGTIHYLTAADVAAGEQAIGKVSSMTRTLRLAELFASFELTFRSGPGAPLQTYRHISANLDNTHLAADPRALKHLEAKGEVTAMTKAASYLLWWQSFATIRGYLLDHLVWMVSDSTGIPPNFLDPAKFEIVTYGKFLGTLLKGSKEGQEAYVKAWATQPERALPFMFGYPGKGQHAHLVVTKRKAPTP